MRQGLGAGQFYADETWYLGALRASDAANRVVSAVMIYFTAKLFPLDTTRLLVTTYPFRNAEAGQAVCR